jgi:SAM-dependent methyltransferase
MESKKYYNHDRIWQQRVDKSQPLWGAYSPIVYSGILQMLSETLSAPADVLDVGCGAGALGARLQPEGYSYTGVDESSVAIELGRKYFPNLNLHRADFAADQLPADYCKKFDAVLSVNSLHCLVEKGDRLRFLANMRSCCRGGESILILTTMSLPVLPNHRLSTSPRALLESRDIITELRQAGWGEILLENLQPATEQAPIANLSVIIKNSH